MSTTTKGGASLRLITGLTFAGLAVCAVVAANLHVKLDPSCTLSRRSTAATADYIAGGDSVRLQCTGLTSSTDYKVYVSSSDASSWNTASGRGTGSGSSSANASPLPNTDGSGNKYKIFNTGMNNALDKWILTGNATLSNATVTVEQGSSIPDGETFTIPVTGSVDIEQISFTYANNPISIAVQDAQLNPSGFSNLTAESTYEFKVVSGSGFNTTGAGGSGTAMSPYTLDTSGVKTIPVTMGSNGLTSSVYIDADTGGGATSVIALADTNGDIIYQLPTLTTND